MADDPKQSRDPEEILSVRSSTSYTGLDFVRELRDMDEVRYRRVIFRTQKRVDEMFDEQFLGNSLWMLVGGICKAYFRLCISSIHMLRILGRPKLFRRPPGSISESILRFVFPKKAFREVFAQAIADMRDEYIDALALHRKWHARWINVRGHLGLALTVAAYLATTVGKKVVQIWKLGS
ncbi:hypothetical protein [Citromicrobium bathyomarinum]|uniref:hypothetical protein n=1 Tax=Citromicrobium bathyomarinum TaxID=72174 RepID=UPI00315A2D87